ncbi:TPA: hypothetical protein UL761_001727 [Stenotrophomonas maltophilia]|uniref:hypothetical protein n=1 Tax=Stenotrophomonas sp. TaxID=69392 RepID=UPI002AA1C3A6|nr:hypothetical protein [Stenotrophomonas maltophilia]
MPFNFEPQEKSAVDEKSRISILRPRMLPDPSSDGSAGIEYQYEFRRDGRTVGALGVFGKVAFIATNGSRERQYTLDLSPDWVLEDILRLAQYIDRSDHLFSIIQSIAQGLVNSFAGQRGKADDVRYIAFTHLDSLLRLSVKIPGCTIPLDDGVIVLASAFVQADQMRS